MKNYLLLLSLAVLILASCKDDEPEIDPLIGEWELDEAAREVSGFTYFNFEDRREVYGESSYIMEFKEDFTYEREIDGIPTSQGLFNFDDEGEWEKDDEDLDLDSEDTEISFIPYSFEIIEISSEEMTLSYTSSIGAFTDEKINEWLEDGTLTQSLQFTVETQAELDSIYDNFQVTAEGAYTLIFEKND